MVDNLSGESMMTSFRKTFLVLGAVLGATWFAAGTPAYAAGAKSEAKEECTDLLQDKGYKGVDIDQAKKRGDDKVAVQADANRKGSEHDVTCVYNENTDKARIKK
jgi:hypothetical protein